MGATPAPAAPGIVTEYPIPIETTPYGMTTGPDGKIWFVDSGNHTGGTFIGRMATTGASSSAEVVKLPTADLGLAATLGPDGNMWVAQDSHIDKVPLGVGETSQITSYPMGSGTGGYGSIVSGPDGRLWFGFDERIGAITTSGAIESYATTSTTSIQGVIVGPDGKLWFGESNKIARIDTNGKMGPGDEFPLPSGDGSIEALALGPDGNVWFTLGSPAAIGKVTPTGTITIYPTPTPSSLPFGIAVGPDGYLWFPELNNHSIGSIPTTATSGAEITEYPVPDKVGGLYITAGPDRRMWFSQGALNELGAITTNTSVAITPQPPTGPIAPPPGPPPPELPSLPAVPAPVGCLANKLILTDVFSQGGKTQLLGVAPRAAAGKTVTIVSTWNEKVVARALVRPDLSFKASVPLPPSSLRLTNSARYVAMLGKTRSLALKFSRRMYTTAITAKLRTITFKGVVTPPLAKPLGPVVIRAAASCSKIEAGTVVASVKPRPDGTFTASIDLPGTLDHAPAVYLRAQTKVRMSARSKRTFPTFTLVRGVKLAP